MPPTGSLHFYFSVVTTSSILRGYDSRIQQSRLCFGQFLLHEKIPFCFYRNRRPDIALSFNPFFFFGASLLSAQSRNQARIIFADFINHVVRRRCMTADNRTGMDGWIAGEMTSGQTARIGYWYVQVAKLAKLEWTNTVEGTWYI
jgi:hypothetical protein